MTDVITIHYSRNDAYSYTNNLNWNSFFISIIKEGPLKTFFHD